MYKFLSSLNIILWKTFKIALAKCFYPGYIKIMYYVCNLLCTWDNIIRDLTCMGLSMHLPSKN